MCVVVAVIVWLLDLLPVVSSDPVQHYVIKCVSELRQVGDFLRVFRFPPPINRTWIVSRVIYILIVNLTLCGTVQLDPMFPLPFRQPSTRSS
jgi:hypothetical protein